MGKEPVIETDGNPPPPHQETLVPTNTSLICSSGNTSSQTQPELAKTGEDENIFQPAGPRLGDSQRTISRYTKAVKRLKKSLKLGRENWEGFAFPEVEGVSETITQMRGELETALNTWKVSRDNPDLWSKAKQMAAQVFTATSPFFKNFLTVAINAQSV